MFRYLIIFSIFALFFFVQGHTFNKLVSDADLQAALMPQELNPAFSSDKDAPWRVVLPIQGRQRRSLEVLDPQPQVPTVSQNIKLYSRMATCVALAFAAIVEIILYVVEFYTVA